MTLLEAIATLGPAQQLVAGEYLERNPDLDPNQLTFDGMTSDGTQRTIEVTGPAPRYRIVLDVADASRMLEVTKL